MVPSSALLDLRQVTDLQTALLLLQELRDVVWGLQQRSGEVEAENAKLKAENAALKRALLGPKSERMPAMEREVSRARQDKEGDDKGERRRRRRKKKKNKTDAVKGKLPVIDRVHEVPDEMLCCPHCGASDPQDFRDLGEGEVSYEYEFVPAHFVRIRHVRKKKACRCNAHVVTAPAPDRVCEGGHYGPGFHAQVVVGKCLDVMPLYRQAKQLQRVGLPIHRSTLCDMFHRVADLLRVLRDRMLELIAQDPLVNADETSIRVQHPGETRRAFMWTFIAARMVTYVFAPDRSGETPKRVLGDSRGLLQVDGYSGYNHVTTPDKRTRVGCMAHARRYWWAARETAPDEAQHVLDLILELYVVEYEAAEQDILGTERHLLLRQAKSAPMMDDWHTWLKEQQPQHPPQSPVGRAITYTRNNWDALNVFLDDAKVALDNNISERQLRLIAQGRKVFLFVGHDLAGDNLAVVQSLVASCELNDVNPHLYLTDVLIRIQHHPASKIDDLLPHNWKHLFEVEARARYPGPAPPESPSSA